MHRYALAHGFVVLSAALVFTVPGFADGPAAHDHHEHHADAAEAPTQVKKRVAPPPYLLATCPVSGEKLGEMGAPYVLQHEGREVRLCCEHCVDKFKGDPAAYIARMDAQLAKQQRPTYPLTTCVVSGDSLDEMGGPIELIHQGRLVSLCCEKCIGEFKADPEKFLKKIDQAVIEQQGKTYPLTTCVVSGQPLGTMGDAVDVVIGTRLVRLCCEHCKDKLNADPLTYLAKIDAAREAK